ncbi:unnamed protein product [[Candida] boidinii]|uniref:Unnamed protein product n=1 Tax=Candida boidinii TaxID=5477 RepID=A0A9W6T4C8_CANBO|nr:unnamed protein product [[Candida] boidinii]
MDLDSSSNTKGNPAAQAAFSQSNSSSFDSSGANSNFQISFNGNNNNSNNNNNSQDSNSQKLKSTSPTNLATSPTIHPTRSVDGMAVNPSTKAGYFGTGSSSSFLRTLKIKDLNLRTDTESDIEDILNSDDEDLDDDEVGIEDMDDEPIDEEDEDEDDEGDDLSNIKRHMGNTGGGPYGKRSGSQQHGGNGMLDYINVKSEREQSRSSSIAASLNLKSHVGYENFSKLQINSKLSIDLLLHDDYLNSTSLQKQLIEAYFKYYHTSYPFIHKQSFVKYFNNELPVKHKSNWLALLNTVLALGCWCLCGEETQIDLAYYQRAKYYLKGNNTVFESGNILLLSCLILLSNYVQKRNKPNTGWNYLGLAVRMAMSLALYKEFPNKKDSSSEYLTEEERKTILDSEIKRRLWWGLYIFDAGASITFGRPINLPPQETISTKLVSNINDETLNDMLNDQSLKVVNDAMLNKPYPTVYSAMIQQTKFTLLTSPMYTKLLDKHLPSLKECLEMNAKLTDFVRNLPNYFSEHNTIAEQAYKNVPENLYPGYKDRPPTWLTLSRHRLIWRYKNLQIILFRPFIWQKIMANDAQSIEICQTEDARKCRRICLDAASETITSIYNYVNNERDNLSLIATWYATYFVFQASLILIACICSRPGSSQAQNWFKSIQMAKKALLVTGKFNVLGKKFVGLTNKLISSVVDKDGNLLDEAKLKELQEKLQPAMVVDKSKKDVDMQDEVKSTEIKRDEPSINV